MVFYEGVPQPPRVLSSPTSSQSTTYTLVFTVESYQPLREVKIRLWPQLQVGKYYFNPYTYFANFATH